MPDFIAYVRQHLPLGAVPGHRQAKIVEEVALLLEERYQSRIQEGASHEDAWAEALGQVPSWAALAGELAAPRLALSAAPRGSWLRRLTCGLGRDVRFGSRLLWKDRGFALTAVLTLAVCIAANAAIFSVVNARLLHVLPVPEPDRILLMANQYPLVGGSIGFGTVSAVPDYFDRLQYVRALEHQAMYSFTGQTLEIAGVPTRVGGLAVTPSFFRVLRLAPALGRPFEDTEGEAGHDNKMVLSDGLWKEAFGGDPAIIGKEIRLSGRPYAVVGVLPASMTLGAPFARFWIPLVFSDQQKSDAGRHSNGLLNIARLRPDATIAQVKEQLKAVDAINLERAGPLKALLINAGFYSSVEPFTDMLVRDMKSRLYLLWAGALVVLSIGGVNLANLAIARSRFRARDLATRLALGAGRARLTRQLLVEGLLLAAAGGVAGLTLGIWLIPLLQAIGLAGPVGADAVHVDVAVVAVSLGLAAFVGALVGLVSALPLLRVEPGEALNEHTRGGTAGRNAQHVRRLLIASQVACTFVLLVGAGLLLVSFQNLAAVDPGFRTEGIVTARVGVPAARQFDNRQVHDLTSQSLAAIRAIPAVWAAGATSIMPLGGNYSSGIVVAEGYIPKPSESVISAIRAVVTPGYFEAIGTPLVRGRFFDARDDEPSARSVIVDERLARRFWGDENPIGRRVHRPANAQQVGRTDANTQWLTVVGVVGEARLRGLVDGGLLDGTFYTPSATAPPRDFGVVIRTASDPGAIIRAMRAALAALDREMPVYDVRTMIERAELSLMPRKATMLLASFFGGVALLLSGLGIYGVLAYLVTQRTREIGIRIALGSSPRRVFRLVLQEGLLVVGAGVVVGLAGALGLGRVMGAQLYGVGAADPLVLSLVAVAVAVTALAACFAPARRATEVDPITVLNTQ